MTELRKPAVANMFYSGDRRELEEQIKHMISIASLDEVFNNVFGIVSPHAGYMYSGQCAAYAYKALANKDFDTAVILSPSHREYFYGVSIYGGDAYQTPLGKVEIDKQLREKFSKVSEQFFVGFQGHGAEHAVEVQIPFLQVIRPNIKIVPMVIGDQRREVIDELADSIAELYSDKTVVIASTDLSHFYPKEIATEIDTLVEKRITDLAFDELQKDLELKNCEACGGGGIVALLKAADKLDFSKSKILSHNDSGDVSGDNSSVVGYLSAVIYK